MVQVRYGHVPLEYVTLAVDLVVAFTERLSEANGPAYNSLLRRYYLPVYLRHPRSQIGLCDPRDHVRFLLA